MTNTMQAQLQSVLPVDLIRNLRAARMLWVALANCAGCHAGSISSHRIFAESIVLFCSQRVATKHRSVSLLLTAQNTKWIVLGARVGGADR